ncbi:MAG: hypothetical protein ACLT98_09275 [Eggerthellaceae bacterium]
MTCHAEHGVCQKCRLGPCHRSSGQYRHGCRRYRGSVHGEPGTQLTMRTFHAGGVAGDDITAVFRVLPSCSRPASLKLGCSCRNRRYAAGFVRQDHKTSRYTTRKATSASTCLARAQLLPGIFDGCQVKPGQQLTKGSVNPHDLLRLTGPNTTLRYIVARSGRVRLPGRRH